MRDPQDGWRRATKGRGPRLSPREVVEGRMIRPSQKWYSFVWDRQDTGNRGTEGVGLGQLKRLQGETKKRAVYQALDEETCRVQRGQCLGGCSE